MSGCIQTLGRSRGVLLAAPVALGLGSIAHAEQPGVDGALSAAWAGTISLSLAAQPAPSTEAEPAAAPRDGGEAPTLDLEKGAATGTADLAKKLANPISDLVSVPFQFNYDEGFGPKDAGRYALNIQPVIPITLTDDLNLITRTIIPVI